MRVTAVLVLALAFAAPAAGAGLARTPAGARRALDRAVTLADASAIREARDAFALLTAAEPGSPERLYWLALADWRLVPMLADSEKTSARLLVREGIGACDRAVARRPKFADAVALKAALQGLAYQFVSRQAGMALGAEMEEGYGRALALEPANPRVLLLKGLNDLYKPKDVGGGPEKAKSWFERSLAAFAKAAPAGDDAIDWGRDDALLWSGVCASRLGDWRTARERFREVLARSPDHAWVKKVLLPEAEKQLAGGDAKEPK